MKEMRKLEELIAKYQDILRKKLYDGEKKLYNELGD